VVALNEKVVVGRSHVDMSHSNRLTVDGLGRRQVASAVEDGWEQTWALGRYMDGDEYGRSKVGGHLTCNRL